MLTHRFDVDAPNDPDLWMRHEWLLTNGTGAYAMGSAVGINTRRYHGLLVACSQPPVGRVMVVNQMLERITLPEDAGGVVETTACAFLDDQSRRLFAPRGHEHLTTFEKGTHVAWTYRHPAFTLVRRLRLHWKQQAVTIEYAFTCEHDAVVALAPMVTLRDFHAMRHRGQDHGLRAQVQGDKLHLASHDAQAVLHAPGSRIVTTEPPHDWWYAVHYAEDQDRGQEDREDHFIPARLEYALTAGRTHRWAITVTLGDEPASPQLHDDARTEALSPRIDTLRQSWPAQLPTPPGREPADFPTMLALAADDFVVDRLVQSRRLSTILAGYPWFADWGRDTFISLPGLLLHTGRHDEARDVLLAFALHIRDGLVPNRFDDYHADNAHYNTVDASLWFIHAAMAYQQAADDPDTWRDHLAPACIRIIEAYRQGTRHDIQMTGDCLITAGNAHTQLTWMDAACNGVIFTPRQGKAVEINALWFHALTGLSHHLATTHAPQADHYAKLANRAGRSFVKVFWDNQRSCLHDHVWLDDQSREQIDTALRPNQILAASLPHSPLPRTKRRQVIAAVRQELLIPYGLRTLPADDPHYHGRYHGPAMQRDEAYHQGTAWPWLIGPYLEALLRTENFSPKAKQQVRQALLPLLRHLAGPGTGQLAEIHEADAPHRPVGCPAQAWSVAQVIHVLTLLNQSPITGG